MSGRKALRGGKERGVSAGGFTEEKYIKGVRAQELPKKWPAMVERKVRKKPSSGDEDGTVGKDGVPPGN